MSQTAVELAGAFPQEVNGHLNSLWSKQFLRCKTTCSLLEDLFVWQSEWFERRHNHIRVTYYCSFTFLCMWLSHSTESISWMSDFISRVTTSSSPGPDSICNRVPEGTPHGRGCWGQWWRIMSVLMSVLSIDSVYPRAGWWFLDRRGPGWLTLQLKTSQISALWYSAAADAFYCLHQRRCPAPSERLGEMIRYLFMFDCLTRAG